MLHSENAPAQPDAIARLFASAGWKKILLPRRRLQRLYDRSRDLLEHPNEPEFMGGLACEGNIFESALRALQVSYSVSQKGLGAIPASGAAVAVANHPFGMLDGLLLGALLLRLRPDVKIIANRLLASIPEMAPYCIYAEIMEEEGRRSINTRGVREAIRHLRNGGMLALFPAGEVAHWQPRAMSVVDPEWNDSAARLAALCNAPAIPVSIQGANSLAFQISGMIHPKLRTLQLPRELLNKQGHHVNIVISPPISAEKLKEAGDVRTATSMLRWNTEVLALAPARASWQPRIPRRLKRIDGETDPAIIERELHALPERSRLLQQGEFEVYEFTSLEAPAALREIGRLREIAFRALGEGSGNSLDLDRFDGHYTHLVLWHRERRQIAGSYRLANVADAVRGFGLEGLYTSTLFRYDPSFFDGLDGALELGRSFVRPEYQKHYMSLLLLWKGIGAYLVRHPSTPVLFGAVSVSNLYLPASRELIASFLQAHMAPAHLTAKVQSRNPFAGLRRSPRGREQDFARVLTLADISERIASWESDGKDLPILIKHYLKLGGRTLAFAVDPKFSATLDALTIVDLRQSDPAILSRYMGKAGAQSFLAATPAPASSLSA